MDTINCLAPPSHMVVLQDGSTRVTKPITKLITFINFALSLLGLMFTGFNVTVTEQSLTYI